MNHITKALQLAINGGYNVGPVEVDMICDNKYDHHFLDPLFWQSLGKALGWGKNNEGVIVYRDWLKEWHRFIDKIANGGTADDFFKELLNP